MDKRRNVGNTDKKAEKEEIPSKYGWVIFQVFSWNLNPQLKNPRRSIITCNVTYLIYGILHSLLIHDWLILLTNTNILHCKLVFMNWCLCMYQCRRENNAHNWKFIRFIYATKRHKRHRGTSLIWVTIVNKSFRPSLKYVIQNI